MGDATDMEHAREEGSGEDAIDTLEEGPRGEAKVIEEEPGMDAIHTVPGGE